MNFWKFLNKKNMDAPRKLEEIDRESENLQDEYIQEGITPERKKQIRKRQYELKSERERRIEIAVGDDEPRTLLDCSREHNELQQEYDKADTSEERKKEIREQQENLHAESLKLRNSTK